MSTIIKNNAITESLFEMISIEQLAENPVLGSQAYGLVPLAFYLEHYPTFAARSDIGVWLASSDDVEAVSEQVLQLPVIALHFPTFADGRAYSSAVILRTRLNYQGEIRAIGDVRRDELEQMQRCGFDAFQLAEGQDFAAGLEALSAFSFNYQASIDRPTPLFRQRS